MDRRTFVHRMGIAAGAAALTPADLLFPGSPALAGVSDADLRATLDRLRAERPCRAEVRTERGGPRLFVNGAEQVPVWGLSISLVETVENFKGMGMQLLQPQMGMMSAWTGPGQYDFTALEAYLTRILTLAPGAFLFPRVQLLTPVWWKEAHPEETQKFGWDVPARYWDGWRTRPTDNPLREGNHQFTNFYGEAWETSYASDVWRRDTAAMLQALVRFIDQSPLAARMMGYFFVHGNTEEWNVGGDNWMPGYEAPMQRAAGPVPSPQARLDNSYGLLRDPAKENDVIHFYRRFHEVRAETIADLAKAVKEASTRPVVTGTFFGYLMETPRIHESGHLAPRAVLESPHVDVIACPYTYTATNDPAKQRWESDLYDGADNWIGRARGVGGDGAFRSMVESYRRRGKLYISEIDPGSYRHQARIWKEIGGSGAMTPEGTVNILRRDFGNVMASNVGGWLYDFGPYNFSDWSLDEPTTPGGWYGGPEIIEAVGRVIRMMRGRFTADVSPVAEIAVAGDPEGFLVSQHWLRERPWPGQGIRYTDFFNHWFFNAQARALYRIGAPIDLLYRDDLTAEDYRKYKLVLVPNSFLLTPAQIDDLHARLRGSGCTVIWTYAPGLLRPEQNGAPGGVDLAQMARLTGFRFYEIGDPGPMLIAANVPGVGEKTFGIKSPHYYSPRFSVEPGDGVETLGHWTMAEGRGPDPRIAFARRQMEGWTSIYVGAPPIPVEFLRRFAADAGAHLWTDRPAVVNGSRAGAMVVCTDPATPFGAAERRHRTPPARSPHRHPALSAARRNRRRGPHHAHARARLRRRAVVHCLTGLCAGVVNHAPTATNPVRAPCMAPLPPPNSVRAPCMAPLPPPNTLMDRRTFVQRMGIAAGAAALSPADLVFPGTEALTGVSEAQAQAALDRLRAERPCRAEVRSERGGPRLFVNGREQVPFWGLSTMLLTGPLDNYKGMGMNFIQPHLGMASAWTGPGQYDFRRLEAYLARLLALHPGAYFFPRVQLQTPIWWKEAHPEETLKIGFGDPGDYWDSLRKRNTVLGEGDHRVMYISEAWETSFASEVWRRDTADMLRAFVTFIERSPLVARMMGYFFVFGTTEEWNHPADDWMPDYSAPMQRAAGPVPPPRERIGAGYGLLRNPAEERHVIHFYRSFHNARAETIAQLASAVKEACDRRVLTGTFFGYLMETPRIQESGHLNPGAVLESPDVDCIACPYTYQATNDPTKERWESDLWDGADTWMGRARGVGGDGAFRSMVESYQRRGKLYISEIDPSTYLDEGRGWPGIGGNGHTTPEGTRQIIRRDLGNVLAAGVGGWYYDFGPSYQAPKGWYAGADIIADTRQVLALMQARLTHDIGSVAKIAVAGDTESFFATRHWMADRPWPGQGVRYTDFFNHWFLNGQARTLYRVGQPADLLYRTDLTAEDFRKYRLVLVPNTYLLSPEEVDTLHAQLAGSGCTVVWYYAPGLLRHDRVDLAQMERLTGFRYDEINDLGPLMIDALAPDGTRKPFGIKSPILYSPRFSVKGALGGAPFETLGYWAGSPAPAFTRRQMDGWTSVYVGTAPLPADVLRRLATDAGAAPWTDRPAVVNASRAGAMVVGQDREGTPGPLTVTFPFPMVDETGGAARTVHTLDLAFGDVRLFTAA